MPGDILPFFVYGTLRPELNANWLALEPYAEEHREAALPGFRLYANGVPYIGVGRPRDVVRGNLVTVRDRDYWSALAVLDGLEGYDPPDRTMYIRAGVSVWIGKAQWVAAWVYLGGPAFSFNRAAQVRDGDYVAYIRRRREAYQRAREEEEVLRRAGEQLGALDEQAARETA